MNFQHTFIIPTRIEHAAELLADPELVTRCMPGASLSGVEGDTFFGVVRVKLGPMQVDYRGKARFVPSEEDEYVVRIEASGNQLRGSGKADATVTAQLNSTDEGGTLVSVDTGLTITGRPAQMGKGLIADVGERLLTEFADNLARELDATSAQGDPSREAESRAPESLELIRYLPVPVWVGMLALLLVIVWVVWRILA